MDLKSTVASYTSPIRRFFSELEPNRQNSTTYQRLRRNEIRLVVLLPGEGNDQIELELHLRDFRKDIKYEALSYCWGDQSSKEIVRLQGYEVEVTPNLASALRHLRHESY